jgi:hypothetical protein
MQFPPNFSNFPEKSKRRHLELDADNLNSCYIEKQKFNFINIFAQNLRSIVDSLTYSYNSAKDLIEFSVLRQSYFHNLYLDT